MSARYPDLDGLSLTELIERFEGPGPEESDDYYWEIASGIRSCGVPGNHHLTGLLKKVDRKDELRLCALLWALSIRPQGEKSSGYEPLTRRQRKRLGLKLEDGLRDTRSRVVTIAIDGFWWLRDPKPRKRIVRLLRHRSGYVRSGAVQYLAVIDSKAALPMLLDALDDKNEYVKDAAIDGLLAFHEPALIPVLEPLLKDRSHLVTASAEYAIESLGFWQEMETYEIELKQEFGRHRIRKTLTALDIIRLIEDPAQTFVQTKIIREAPVKAMIRALRFCKSARGRALLAYALGRRGAKSAVPLLIECLQDPSETVRGEAADVLGDLAVENVLAGESLLRAFEHETGLTYRGTMASALGGVRYRPAIPRLIEALNDSDSWVRAFAARSLGYHLRAQVARQPIQDALQKETDAFAIAKMQEALSALDEPDEA